MNQACHKCKFIEACSILGILNSYFIGKGLTYQWYDRLWKSISVLQTFLQFSGIIMLSMILSVNNWIINNYYKKSKLISDYFVSTKIIYNK